METTCIRQTDVPGASKLFTDFIYHFDRVADLYPRAPNDVEGLAAATRFDFPDERRLALVNALQPLNARNPSLAELAKPGTTAIVTGQQVGLFSGPAYTIYKALTAIRTARALNERGIAAVPVFWLATEDHDFNEVNHAWVFGADHQPVRLEVSAPAGNGSHPVGGIRLENVPLGQLRETLSGLPFAEDAAALIERAYRPGETMGSAFARMIEELFRPWGLLLVDPMEPALRQLAAPLLAAAVEQMPELIEALIARGKELAGRGYHAQVLVEKSSSLVFLLDEGRRVALRRSNGEFVAPHRKLSARELMGNSASLSANALLRPVVQDYLLPTAAYIGGPAELAYLAQSQVLYARLLDRQPVALTRASFTLLGERSHRRMARYQIEPAALFKGRELLQETIAARLVPDSLRWQIEQAGQDVARTLDTLSAELHSFDITLAGALETSRRKMEYQIGKIARKTAKQIMARDGQAARDAQLLSGLVYPGKHLQERFYSIVPFIAKFGPGIVDELYSAVRVECPDHQFVVV